MRFKPGAVDRRFVLKVGLAAVIQHFLPSCTLQGDVPSRDKEGEKKFAIKLWGDKVKINQFKLDEVHALSLVFMKFCLEPDVLILPPNFPGFSERWGPLFGVADPDSISLSSLHFTNPSFPGQHLLVAFHEFSHVILYDYHDFRRMELSDLFKLLSKKSSIERLAAVLLFNIANTYNKENGIFRIFDESSYFKDKYGTKSNHFGHPYSNHQELFASALTVFRFFPEEFLERLNELELNERKLVSSIASCILRILEHRSSASEDLVELLPEFYKIKSEAGKLVID